MRNLAAIAIALGMVAFAGCSREGNVAPTGKADVRPTYEKMSDGDVLVRVGTNEFTKGDLKSRSALRKAIVERANAGRLGGRKINGDVIELQTLVRYPQQVGLETILATYAATNGISAAKEDVEKAQMAICGKGWMGGWKSFSAGLPKSVRKTLGSEVRRLALKNAVRRDFLRRQPVAVADEEVQKAAADIEGYNSRAAATNAAAWAAASNVWRKVASGEMKFEDAAERYNEDEGGAERGAWGAFTSDALSEDGDLLGVVQGLKEGETSAPVEGDNGLMLVRLDAVEKPESGSGPLRYALSRIFFHLPEFVEKADVATVRAEMLRMRENKAFAEFVKGLAEDGPKPKVTCDKKIFEDARAALKMPTTML